MNFRAFTFLVVFACRNFFLIYFWQKNASTPLLLAYCWEYYSKEPALA
jgi:hypothetical protein